MVRWIKSEVRRLISEALAPIVNAAGFRFKKRSEAFIRKIDGGRQELGLPLYDYNPEFEFSFVLCIRLEAVQEILNRFAGSLPKYHGITLTSLTQLEFLGLPGKPGRDVDCRYRVNSEAELVAILPGVLTLVRERVLPFFEEYRDIAAVNRGLNPEGAERVFQIPLHSDRRAFDATDHPYRAMAGVTVAHLAGDSRLKDLIAAYRSQIGTMQEQDQRFEQTVEYLRAQAHAG